MCLCTIAAASALVRLARKNLFLNRDNIMDNVSMDCSLTRDGVTSSGTTSVYKDETGKTYVVHKSVAGGVTVYYEGADGVYSYAQASGKQKMFGYSTMEEHLEKSVMYDFVDYVGDDFEVFL